MILAKLNSNEILASSVTLNYETNKELTVDGWRITDFKVSTDHKIYETSFGDFTDKIQKCDAALRSAELLPYGTRSCNGKTGNYLQRTVCEQSSTTFDPSTHSISLPKGREAACL